MHAAVSTMHIDIDIEGKRSGNKLSNRLLTCNLMVPGTNTP